MSTGGPGWTVLIGGSGPEGMSRRLIQRFVDLAGGAEDARVVVVPTASEQRAETIERYVNAFELEDTEHVKVLDIRTRRKADEPETLAALDDATGVIFTGGDQSRLLSILGHTHFVAELKRCHLDGLVVGGSSAGAMALGDPVIVHGEPTTFYKAGAIHHVPGLDVLEGVTVDTHLVARGRLVRLLPVVAARPDVIGLGIEEGSGVTVSPEGVATVLGDGVVCIVDAAAAELGGGKPGGGKPDGDAIHGEADRRDGADRRRGVLSVTGLLLHVLADGDTFDLRARRVVSG